MSKAIDPLLAKSVRPGETVSPSARLLGHLKDAYTAARRLLATTGADQLRAFGLDPDVWLDRFSRCLLLAAAIHDIGKANDHFQRIVKGQRNPMTTPQGLRHEWVTVLMMQMLRPCLMEVLGSERDFDVVMWAVAGHHPSSKHPSPPRSCPPGASAEMKLLLSALAEHGLREWLVEAAATSSVGNFPACTDCTVPLTGTTSAFETICSLWRTSRRTWNQYSQEPLEQRFVAAVKAALIAADVAGSALPRVNHCSADRWQWINNAFANRPEPGEMEQIVAARLRGAQPRPFQVEVAASTAPVTYVKAGCGSGKTIAAYMWAAQQHPTRRLYFCYPTTGTATEGFRDYLFEPDGALGALGAKLFHSRRDVDLEVILGVDLDTEDPERDQTAALESLEAWSTPIVVCTVDTVLGLMQNHRRGLIAWPALAQSAFVFDEIHAYDDDLFGALLRFLRDLPGLPALLMTASLTKAREQRLLEVIEARGAELSIITGPPELEELPRYHKQAVDNNDPLPAIARELHNGGKVLWVCNTVDRVMAAADRVKKLGLTPLVYHSRFKYVDRVDRHKAVVDAFAVDRPGPALAICSQVAEMSLDLKGCTMLVADLAPVPPLIQRLGRLHRQACPGNKTCPFIVITPETAAPYRSEELEAAKRWLAKLPETQISQRILAERWEQDSESPAPGMDSAWLDGGPITQVKELRQISPGISVLMRTDADQTPSTGKRNWIIRHLLPMNPPRGLNWRSWPRICGVPVCEDFLIDYDPMRGAKWQDERNNQPLIV